MTKEEILFSTFIRRMTPLDAPLKATTLQGSTTDFAANNSVIYGVSRDSIASHDKFINKFNYTIDLISDEDESLCKQFDVLKLKKMYGKEHIGIVRSTFVISPDGDILKQWDKVKVDGHAEEVLDFIKAL